MSRSSSRLSFENFRSTTFEAAEAMAVDLRHKHLFIDIESDNGDKSSILHTITANQITFRDVFKYLRTKRNISDEYSFTTWLIGLDVNSTSTEEVEVDADCPVNLCFNTDFYQKQPKLKFRVVNTIRIWTNFGRVQHLCQLQSADGSYEQHDRDCLENKTLEFPYKFSEKRFKSHCGNFGFSDPVLGLTSANAKLFLVRFQNEEGFPDNVMRWLDSDGLFANSAEGYSLVILFRRCGYLFSSLAPLLSNPYVCRESIKGDEYFMVTFKKTYKSDAIALSKSQSVDSSRVFTPRETTATSPHQQRVTSTQHTPGPTATSLPTPASVHVPSPPVSIPFLASLQMNRTPNVPSSSLSVPHPSTSRLPSSSPACTTRNR
jgi:hypothetical protein